MDNPAVRVEGVCKTFGEVQAVRELDLVVPAGHIYGVLGPNGAGKTTLIRMLMDIIAPDRGVAEVLGSTVPARVRHRVGYLPEERGLYRKMRVSDTLAYFGTIKGVPARRLREQIPTRLAGMGLDRWASSRVDELSKGMQQKLQFLTATIGDPELLILDEPYSGLDPVNLEILTRQILELRDAGRTILLSTHMMEQAQRLCDSVMLIHKGRKVLDGALSDVIGRSDRRTVIVETEGDPGDFSRLDCVASAEMVNRHYEVHLTAEADAQDLLRSLIGRCRILRFEVKRPTLHEVFLAHVDTEPAPARPTSDTLAATGGLS